MLWELIRWTPGAFAIALLLISFAGTGGVEVLVLIALLALQAIIITLPIASKWLGRKVGERRSGSAE